MTRELVTLASSLRDAAFSINAAMLQVEISSFFLRELVGRGNDREHSAERLIGKMQATGLGGEAHIHEMLDRILEQLTRAAHELDGLTTGVSSLEHLRPDLQQAAKSVQEKTCGCETLLPVAEPCSLPPGL